MSVFKTVTVYCPAEVVGTRLVWLSSKRRSRGGSGYAARGHATGAHWRAGAPTREPPLAGRATVLGDSREKPIGPSGRGGRAQRAQARPHAGGRGSAALSQAIRRRGRRFAIHGRECLLTPLGIR